MKKKLSLLSIMLLLACFTASACGAAWHYDPITDVNDLEGRSVGCNLSWETDYSLTGRSDLTLFRYDSTADMIMALSSDKVDAIAVDEMTWRIMSGLSSGLEIAEPEFGTTAYLMYVSDDRKDLRDDFNAYLAEFKKTQKYQEFLESMDTFDGNDYDDPRTVLTGTGDTLKVAYDVEGFPRAFVRPGEKTVTGFDVEILKQYANDRGYKLEFFPSNYEDAIVGLRQGAYDLYTGYLNSAYREEVEKSGLYTTDDMYEGKMFFVQKTQEKIKVDAGVME